ncbi:MAG: adenylosuccinate lyase [Desulfobacter postgatei]|uniref:Adenylosuccinate lyase n=1 Tax=Desulfobacter postgatei TaxID=2293 RepID=A0A2G6MSP3_9BACT|nr:MAG: adenylosuccinate lyase [Desulfobacter postgatei]
MKHVLSITPIDGRYARLTGVLSNIFSESGLIHHRIHVELKWLKFLITDLKVHEIVQADPPLDLSKLDVLINDFHEDYALRVKEIESRTNHDVKAVEYFIKEKLDSAGLSPIREWVHFACTSEDINNTAYGLMLQKGKNQVVELLTTFVTELEKKALAYKSIPMMSRTHGQPATPTTPGKEFINFAWRLNQEIQVLKRTEIQAKINGATGNYNAHVFAFPEIDWMAASERFIRDYLSLEPILFTTQINPNTALSKVLHAMIRAAAVIIDFDRDMWGYISLGYFKQRVKEGETGSSTMPHKVNPIDFENSEGNMGLAISMLEHLSVKLQKSRFQRDLSDSTVLRSLGTVFGYFIIGMKNALKGLLKVELDHAVLERDLEDNPELLAEPFQTVMRVYGEKNPYERLKELTRGKKIQKEDLARFVDGLEKVPPEVKKRMGALLPQTYLGLAESLVDLYFKEK